MHAGGGDSEGLRRHHAAMGNGDITLRSSAPLPLPQDELDRALEAERLRIARELHDAVAYGIGTIALQAGAAAHVIDTSPAQAAEALHAIHAASRDVLADMRAILGQLRAGGSCELARGIG